MKNMIRRKIREFSYNHDFMFDVLKLFFIMVIISIGLIIGTLPIGLCLYFGLWWLLSAFIIWPIGFTGIAWIIDFFDV